MASIEDFMIPCLNKNLFGFECPGCGLQRSVSLIFQGQFEDAFFMYPAIYLIIPLSIAITISIFYKYKYSNKIIGAFAILTVATIIISYLIKIL